MEFSGIIGKFQGCTRFTTTALCARVLVYDRGRPWTLAGTTLKPQQSPPPNQLTDFEYYFAVTPLTAKMSDSGRRRDRDGGGRHLPGSPALAARRVGAAEGAQDDAGLVQRLTRQLSVCATQRSSTLCRPCVAFT